MVALQYNKRSVQFVEGFPAIVIVGFSCQGMAVKMTSRQERMAPKFAKLRHLLERGVIPYTIWAFEGKSVCQGCGKKAIVLYPHSCGRDICCSCWRLCSKHLGHYQLSFGFNEREATERHICRYGEEA